MKFRKRLLLISSFLIVSSAIAQPKSFRERTKFNQPTNQDANPSDQQVTPVTEIESESGEDFFGRGTGIKDVQSPDKKSKFVNLNPETAFGPEVIESFDFPDADILDITKFMQNLTGINLILDKDVKGKISISAPSAITVGDAWKAYLTALNLNGYTLVKSGAFYKIINARDVRYTPTKIYTGSYTPDTENYVMKVIPLKHINGTEITRSFRPFMSRYGRIIDIKQTNTVIVHDTGSNINRLQKLIQFLDVPGHDESLHIIKVQNTSAQEIAKLLDTILKGNNSRFSARARTTAQKSENISRIIAEPRTNSIIAIANAAGLKELQDLVIKLDVKVPSQGGGKIHVYYLNHSDAEALAKTLSGTITAAQGQDTRNRTASRFANRANPNAQEPDADSIFSSDVKITADKDNNALVIVASPTDYGTIKNVISRLDIPKDQVFVEGLIMETSVSKESGFGISIVGAYGTGAAKAGFTGGSSDLVNLLSNNITSLGGLFVGGKTGRSVDLAVPGSSTPIKVNTINGLITAIATHGNTNVLATPQILALDNNEAIFEVGETVPVSKSTNAANGSTSTSIEEQKIALTLKITPQINKVTRFIKLKIDQKIEDFSQREVANAGGGVATTTRSAVTNVVVRDQDTIAMGGLMRDKVVSSENKVPLLGDIPVLGWLFKQKSNQKEKLNMLFFLTPKIIASYERTAAKNLKDVLGRRHGHLKNILDEEDPNMATLKSLYEKAQKQDEGPLYDVEEAEKYRKQNQGSGGIEDNIMPDIPEVTTPSNANVLPPASTPLLDTPNYQDIAKRNRENRLRPNTPGVNNNQPLPPGDIVLPDSEFGEPETLEDFVQQ